MSGGRHSAGVGSFDVVMAVGSQGAFASFQAMVRSLPSDFPAAVVLDLHRANGDGIAERLLARCCALRVRPAQDGVELKPAQLYLAPHDRQLVITEKRRMSVQVSLDGAGHRSADALLTSGARALGPRVIAVVLSGRLDGGARGVREVKRHGGRVIVEDPRNATAPAMPNAALATGCVDFALSPERLGNALLALCAATGAAELFRVRMNAGVAG